MSKINPNASSLIDGYINSRAAFAQEILSLLRKLIHKADNDIVEDWKWNVPVFHTKEMVCGIAAFQKYVSINFFNGAEMSDKHHLFSGDCSAKNIRTIKFNSISEIKENQLLPYFMEAFTLGKTGLKKIESNKEIEIPELLQQELNKNKLAKKNFENMAYTYRKEYASHISGAKQEATKLRRLKNVILNLEKNLKMHQWPKS
ncbi:MAG: YdeI/OmpD-associated family protein [Lutibacter sp.]|nr:YdeI/OmpD-associated family protein [Lutibacter sp.]MDP3946371.1 YdeI/OmpD-associated family protein [Lutibacter sp.]